MRIAHFFIDRPRFATVVSAFLTLIGIGAMFVLPVAQYPEIVPPTVQVTTIVSGRVGGNPSREQWPRRSSSRSMASRTCST